MGVRVMSVYAAFFIHFCISSVSCFSAQFDNNVSHVKDTNITKIYLVSSCHLDLGFANSLVNIVNEYFDKHFPNAIKTANDLKQAPGEERLVFTTHSYLMWLYLNCPVSSGLHCPEEKSVQQFKKAVQSGDIVWHAYPFNAQPEVYDKYLAEFGIKFTQDISKSLGDFMPNAMSQRDVPGLTRSMIPILKGNGIKAITVGVNGASMPPAVPSAFKWVDKTSNTDILAMWHPHGYGGQHGVGTDSMVIVNGMTSALAFGIRGDNSGPPSVLEVIKNFATLKKLYPNAKIVASSYNDFVDELYENSHLLKEYTEEVGDTWIHGVASDPWKTAQFREILRIRSNCLVNGGCSLDDARFYNFSAFLLKYGEHTWGEDVKTYLKDFKNWNDSSFQPLMYTNANYIAIAASWSEQRRWAIDYALEALSDHPIRKTIEQSIKNLYYDGANPTSATKYQSTDCDVFKSGSITFELDQTAMSIKTIKDSRGSSTINFGGSANDQLGQLVYNAYSENDYYNFLSQYLVENTSFAPKDFGKPGLQSSNLTAKPVAKLCWDKRDENSYSFLIQGFFPEDTIKDYGAPEIVWLEVSLPITTVSNTEIPINMTLYLGNKTSTRIPESLSLYFHPNLDVIDSSKMVVSKLGQQISVLDVVKNGSKHVHSTDEGISYNGKVPFKVKAWDTSVVTIGGTNAFPVPCETPDVNNGFGFNIFNNIWGTNYVMWYPYEPADQSSKYRFTITLPPKENIY